MNTCLTAAEIDPRPDARLPERERLAQVDGSLRGPVLMFVLAGVAWLLLGTLFGMIAGIKLHAPGFLGNSEWLTYGRVRAAHLNSMAFGWADNAAFAVILWVMARLGGTRVRHLGLLWSAGVFWNLAVLWGVAGILCGGLTSVDWLEMPRGVGPVLLVSYSLIAVWGILSFWYRQTETVYVSQWYLLAGLFWFPWLYFVAQTMVLWEPARGTVQAAVDAWFVGNLQTLWYGPVAVGVAYYLLPKLLGRPLYAYYLAPLGFWALALFGSWAGGARLIYGPVPAWLQTTGVIGSVLVLAPAVVVAVNFVPVLWAGSGQVWSNPILRFVAFGVVAYLLLAVVMALSALRDVAVVTQFTQFTVGRTHQALYASFSMVAFGAIYYLLPRVLGREEWPSLRLVNVHFWCAAIGGGGMVLVLYVFGFKEGLDLDNPALPFLDVVKSAAVMNHLRSVTGLLITIGHLAFLLNLAMLTKAACCRWTGDAAKARKAGTR